MTILFLEEQGNTKQLRVNCPSCRTPQDVTGDTQKTVGEICPSCNALFSIRLFASGMVVVE